MRFVFRKEIPNDFEQKQSVSLYTIAEFPLSDGRAKERACLTASTYR